MFIRFKNLFSIKGYSVLVICMLMIGIGISITSPYIPLFLTKDFGMSAGAFGIFMAISSLSGVVVNSLIAKHSDNGMDRKWIVIFAAISASLGYASYLVFNNFFILLIVVTLFNGLAAPVMPQIYAYAHESANASKSEDKTFAMSTLRSLISLGFLIGPLCGTLILGLAGYKGIFLGTSILYITVASLVFLFLHRRKAAKSNAKKKKSKGTPWIKNRQIRLPLIAFLFLFAINTIHLIITPLFIVNELHGTYKDVGLVVSICAGLEIPIMLGLGALGKKISNHTLMIYGCVILVIYYTILSVATHAWQLIPAQLLQATFVAIVMGNGLSYFTERLPNSPGLATTIYSNGSTIGRLVGSLGGGFIAQILGFRHVYWVCLLLAVLAFFILWRSRPHEEMEVQVTRTRSV
ncbi:sugar efflux transporter [Bacillus sp. FJAT-49732]|uniref:Sugar efflux transporter n=1 Tax=Lederbergia citrisecunda TaxID=2833583 RepID=A0A942TPD7_9BACI|nr:sugar efflux transporter [Lederbergia citrisecunda]MBS4202076.1 sugar efflux transporter [Lederbergia citrisecunda]